ncbi:MAG TPA: ABC transporter substrate-binding protein [Candidatus Limnocylindria bacterium]|jgi:peptide/nickel transport system substrate-binding protein|nr:ABC transporter substrate-binding protein [Candidatus Limnocylindria bacterium]
MRSARYSLAFVAAFAILLAACTGGQQTTGGGASPTPAAGKPVYGGTVTFGLENDVSDLDPMRSGLFVDRNIMYAMYDSLVRVDPKGNIIPWLAEKWETGSDGKTVTFTLRKDAKFHDGTTFDADAVKWNIDRYRTTQGSRRTADLAAVDSVNVVDSSTVRFNLKLAFAPLLAALVDRAGMMVSKAVHDAAGADFTLKPFKAGTGPFILTEAVKNDHYTLEKNPNWWGKDKDGNKLPYLEKIIVRPIVDDDVRLTNLRTGNVQVMNDIAGKDVPAVKTDPSLNYQEVGALAFNSMVPNEAPGFIFSEHRYVKAVAMALDRDELLQKGSQQGVGLVGWGPITPAHFAWDPNFKPWPKADPEGAKRLIAEVGRGPLKFELLVQSGSASTLQQAQLIQDQLKRADITADIKTQLFNDIVTLQQQKKHLGMTLVGWSGRLDPDGNTYDFVVTGSPNNDSSYSNAKVDELMKQQRAEPDPAKRKALLLEAQQIYVVDDPSRVWYSFEISPIISVKNLVGLEAHPDRIPRFHTGWLQK